MTIRFHDKGIDVIKKACDGAKSGIICTPYYTEAGLSLLGSFFDLAEKVEFWTRFSPLDWRAGVADMAALKRRVQSVLERQKIFDVRVSDELHAKIYMFSDKTVIIGSANLTMPGMKTNVEVICELTEGDAAGFLPVVSIFRSRLTPVPAEVFTAYVDVASDAISKPFEGPVEEDGEMNAAIDLAEEALRKSLTDTAPDAPRVAPIEIEQFIDYCREENSLVSREIIARHKGRHNLQGHVKHCYYGTMQFLSLFPGLISAIAATPGESLYEFTDQAIQIQWRDFLREHANEIDKQRDFSFRTLRVYLPPSLGGICSGGGGGSGTLKRVFAVVARMLREQGRTND